MSPMTSRPDFQWLAQCPSRFGLEIKEDGHIACDGVDLEAVAQRFGTPTYVYSLSFIQARYQELAQALAGCDATICYALKANSNAAIVSSLAQLGAGADVVSGGELERVMRAGVPPSKIVFSGVGKSNEELRAAIRVDILSINAESIEELERISQVATQLGKTARVSLRLNPDVDAKTHPYLATGLLGSKFGIDMQDAMRAVRRAIELPGLQLVGLACHIGSMVQDAEPYLLCVERMSSVMRELKAQGVKLEHLDLGGGLGIPYKDGDPEVSPGRWGKALCEMAQELGVRLVVEPGRYLVGNGGVLLTRAIGTKQSGDKNYLVVDAAMNDLIRPTLYGAYHGIVPDPVPAADIKTDAWEVVGPVCECGDFLAVERQMAEPDPQGLYVLLSAGAYCMSMASNYNTRKLPAEVLLGQGKMSCVRPRQRLEDILGAECEIAWEGPEDSSCA